MPFRRKENESKDWRFGQYGEAVLAHSGEAQPSRQLFDALNSDEQDAIIEFLKTLQILPPGTKHLIVDEYGRKKQWPPHHDDDHDKHDNKFRDGGDDDD